MLTATPTTVKRRELPTLAAKVFARTLQEAKATQQALMKKSVLLIRAETAEFFDKARGPDGKKWRPLQHPRPNSGGKDKPLQDTGMLRRAATSDAPGSVCRITGDTVTIGVNLVQANLQNYGGVVTPKNGKFLAIPATVEAKRAGSPRRFRRKLKAIINRAGTGGVLVEFSRKKKRGKKNKGKSNAPEKIVQYYLTKKVTIPARPFIGMSDKGVERLQNMWIDHYFESMKRVVSRGGN